MSDTLVEVHAVSKRFDIPSVHRETLRELAPVKAVRGNVDEPDLRSALPERRVAEVEDVRIGMVHIPGPSRGRADRLVGWFPACGAVVYGHTHLPEVTRHRGVWILNPGSPTERRRSACRSMLTLQIDGAEIRPKLVRLS